MPAAIPSPIRVRRVRVGAEGDVFAAQLAVALDVLERRHRIPELLPEAGGVDLDGAAVARGRLQNRVDDVVVPGEVDRDLGARR